MKQEYLRSAFFLLLLGGVLIVVFSFIQPYLITLAVAGTAAIIFHPVQIRLVRLLRGRKTIAAFLMIILTYILVLIPLIILGIQIATEASGMYADLRNGTKANMLIDLQQTLETLLQRYIPSVSIDISNISQYAGQALNIVAGSLQTFFTGTVHAIFLTFLGTIAFFYMLRDGTDFIDYIIRLSPLTEKEDVKLFERLHQAVNSVVRGSLIISILQGTVTGIGLMIFGVPSAVLLGSIAGVGSMIPTIGTTIVLAPVILYLFISGDYVSGIGLSIWGMLAVGMIDNLLQPLLVGRGMRMHPMFTFLAVIGGISYFGISGIILGPLLISLLFGLFDIFLEETEAT